jgi:UDP-glucose 4-epimerase
MRSLVTGGAGFIGSHLADALVAQGDEVVVFDNLSTGNLKNLAGIADRITFIQGDVADLESVREAVADCQRVFHQAAVASVPATIEQPLHTQRVNLAGTLNVLEACRSAQVERVVFASSAAVYGDQGEGTCREDLRPQPQSPYAIEKLAAEHYVRLYADLYGQKTAALRYFNVFGPRQDPRSPYSGVISIFVDRLLRGEVPTIFGDGEQTRDFVYVGDVVRANLAAGAVDAPAGLVCNLGRGQTTTLNALYGHLAKLLGGPPAPNYAESRAGDIRHSLADVRRAKAALGFSAETEVADGLALLVDWVRAQSA